MRRLRGRPVERVAGTRGPMSHGSGGRECRFCHVPRERQRNAPRHSARARERTPPLATGSGMRHVQSQRPLERRERACDPGCNAPVSPTRLGNVRLPRRPVDPTFRDGTSPRQSDPTLPAAHAGTHSGGYVSRNVRAASPARVTATRSRPNDPRTWGSNWRHRYWSPGGIRQPRSTGRGPDWGVKYTG